jgi:hypothetical protein
VDKMNKEEAILIVKESIQRGSSTPCTWRDDRDQYIKEKSTQLLEHIIDPIPVIKTKESFKSDSIENNQNYGIARLNRNWLVYNLNQKTFSLAFGEDPSNLEFLGFSSPDALTEWLG